MAPLDPESLRLFLRLVTLNECLAWSEHAPDDRIRDALKLLLFDRNSGAIRHLEKRILHEELFRLALNDDNFKRFVETRFLKTKDALDRITAEYLKERLDGL